MNINPFLFNSIINAKAKHLGKNHQFIYCQLPDGKTIKAYALTHVSSVNVSIVKFEGNYYCFCGSAPVELSRSTKQLGVRVKRQIKEQSLLFLLIDITKSLENDGVLQAINYINTHNYQFYQYLSFGDTTGYISEPLNKTNILTELQDYYDNYNPDYDDDFYCSEGTDLPENGIDALNDAILSIDNKYLVDLYLVTDNSKYSRNTSEPEDILNLIDEKINKLFIDIIQPKNIPSEQIVIEGFENNPYCSNSAITTVLVNDSKIGNYPKNSNILIKNQLVLSWNGGQRTITNPNNYQVYQSPGVGANINIKGYYKINNGSNVNFAVDYDFPAFLYYYLHSISANFPFVEVLENTANYFKIKILSSNGDITVLKANNYYFGSLWRADGIIRRFDFNVNDIVEVWIDPIYISNWSLIRWYAIIEENNNFSMGLINNPINSAPVIPFTLSSKKIQTTMITESFLRSLVINNQTIQSLEETDIVKAVCQPQIVPITEPNSTLYTTSLPPSNKIVYLN